MDGYAVAGEIRKRPELGNTLLVALTGYGQDRDQRRARDAGFHRYLVKPLNLHDLWDLLARRTERGS
jgi:CheY-like chemotaxis protein